MEFQKRIKLELEDFLAYNFAITKKQMIIALVTLVLVLPVLLVILFDNISDPLFIYIVALIAAILGSGFLVLFSKKSSKKRYYSNKIIQAEFDYTIDNTGIHQSSEYGNTSIVWSDIFKATESKTGIYLFIAKFQAFVIPKRLLSPQEEKTLRAIITANLHAAKNKLSK